MSKGRESTGFVHDDSRERWPAFCLPCLGKPPARGEIIELVDKTKMNGKIVHYYDGVYTVETNDQTIKLPREKIRSSPFSYRRRGPSSQRRRRPSSAGARR